MTFACAGMTFACAGMTFACAGMTFACAGMTFACAGMTHPMALLLDHLVVAARKPEIVALSCGEFRWKIGVPASGSLAQRGIAPTMIEWHGGGHPSEHLPDVGCRLESLVLRHPEALATLHALREAGLPEEEPVRAETGAPGIEARIRTPKGIVALRE